ncbi:MAG: Brp/Blh family beta-carotene 15,15'-dioxygenase [Bacteroidota bacterium]
MLAIFAGLVIPKSLIDDHLLFFSVALILAGVPHGASDYLIFKKLTFYFQAKVNVFRFYFFYIVLIGLYVLTWYYFSVAAFVAFLVISAYHFGQSNWSTISFKNKFQEIFTVLFWGIGIIGIPVLIYFDQASLIIFEIVGVQPVLSDTNKWAILFLLVFGNVANIGFLAENNIIDLEKCKKEIANFLLLVVLFFTTPLLIGFGIYFVFWHSVTAVMDQYKIIRSKDKSFSFKKYLKAIVPLSIMAFIGLALLYFFLGNAKDEYLNLGILFFFISVITVPHAILMDLFYQTDTN